MGAALPAVPLPAPTFLVGDRVEILTGPGTKRWRPGTVEKVTRSRATVKYFVHHGQASRRQTVPFERVRPRQPMPEPPPQPKEAA
jgi:hypothetical protein